MPGNATGGCLKCTPDVSTRRIRPTKARSNGTWLEVKISNRHVRQQSPIADQYQNGNCRQGPWLEIEKQQRRRHICQGDPLQYARNPHVRPLVSESAIVENPEKKKNRRTPQNPAHR